MTSLVARASLGLSSVFRKMGSALDGIGKNMEITKYTEKLVPSTRFVAVDGVGPTVSPSAAFVAPSASIIGNVAVGKESSVWYGTIVRGDVNHVTIGDYTNIQDRAVVHVAKIQGDFPTQIGSYVTIKAGALIHAATLQDFCVIGESAQVLDGATVESKAMVLPGSVVTPGTVVKAGQLWGGSPAKMIRALTEEEMQAFEAQAKETAELANAHAYETSKDYKTILEEEEVADIKMYMDESAPTKPETDISDVLGQGHPGRIFRSTLSHPTDAFKDQSNNASK